MFFPLSLNLSEPGGNLTKYLGIGIIETTIVYWGYIEIMEKKMETTGIIRVI